MTTPTPAQQLEDVQRQLAARIASALKQGGWHTGGEDDFDDDVLTAVAVAMATNDTLRRALAALEALEAVEKAEDCMCSECNGAGEWRAAICEYCEGHGNYKMLPAPADAVDAVRHEVPSA